MTGRDTMARLWAGWRIPYILADDDERTKGHPEGLSLFEGIEQSGLDDSVSYVVWRGARAFALLNAYPYTSGHLMVLPKCAAENLEDLGADTYTELFEGVRMAIIAVKKAYQPDGVNMGMNLGRASGAGVPDHLHVHVLPRWSGDTNFVTSIAEARVLPESLAESWQRIVDAWPS
ncbi:MAG: HIT family protein [Acidimicrobiales bacterium]